MKVAWFLAPIFLGVALGQIQGEHKISVSIDGKPVDETDKNKHLVLSPGQSFTLNCSFICRDDDTSKCRHLEWQKTRRSKVNEFVVINRRFNTSTTVDGRQRLHSALTLKANMTTYGIYTCTVANSWQERVMVDLVEVTAGENVTLSTLSREQKVSKVPYDKRVVNATEKLTLKCTTTTTAPATLRASYWKFKDAVLKDGKKYKITHKGTQLTLDIMNPGIESIGPYECLVNVVAGQKTYGTVAVNSPPIVNLDKEDVSLRQKEGDPFKLVCRISLYPMGNLTVEWFKDNITTKLVPRNGVRLDLKKWSSNATVESTLIFEALTVGDRGLYFCKASTTEGSDYMGWYLRVLDPLAPIWPLIGIILEVITVIIIIVVYELNVRKRRREKKKAEAEHAAALTEPDVGEREEVSGGTTRQRPARV